MAANDLTAARLRELLHYDPETGIFTRRGGVKGFGAESPVGGPDTYGYTRIGVDRRRHRAHRLAWLYVYGRWPIGDIDHINGDRTCNVLSNLRECTRSDNLLNRRSPTPRINKSGYLGVSWCKITRSYSAELKVNGVRVLRQRGFRTAEAASAAYWEAKKSHMPS